MSNCCAKAWWIRGDRLWLIGWPNTANWDMRRWLPGVAKMVESTSRPANDAGRRSVAGDEMRCRHAGPAIHRGDCCHATPVAVVPASSRPAGRHRVMAVRRRLSAAHHPGARTHGPAGLDARVLAARGAVDRVAGAAARPAAATVASTAPASFACRAHRAWRDLALRNQTTPWRLRSIR